MRVVKNYPKELIQQIVIEKKNGLSYSQLSRKHQISTSTIYTWCTRAGISKEKVIDKQGNDEQSRKVSFLEDRDREQLKYINTLKEEIKMLKTFNKLLLEKIGY